MQIVPVLFLVGIALLFWLVLIRPQVRRQRELAHMQSTLEVGDAVLLTSGVFGTIRSLEEDVARVEIADGVTIKVALGAIGQQLSEHHAEDADDTETTHDAPEVSEEN